jgi:hypothetical protein
MRILVLTLAALVPAGLIIAAPDTVDDSLQSLRDAVSKKDAAQIKTLAVQTFEAASKVIAGPTPETEIDKETVNEAREAQSFAEYALFSTALESEPAVRLDLLAALSQESPTSKYLNDGYVYYFQALAQTGGAAKIPAVAEKALKGLPGSPDVLAELLDLASQTSQNDKAVDYAQRLIAVLGKRAQSEIMPDADWQKKKNAMLGRAHLICGVVYVAQTHYYHADQELRLALPLVKGDDPQTATALFNLGLANYQLGVTGMDKAKVLEAMRFSQQCAAIRSQFQDQALHNVQAMKTQAAKMR